jgi:hypothetical protein
MPPSEVYGYHERGGLLVPASVRRAELEAEAPGFIEVLRSMLEEPVELKWRLTSWETYLCVSALQLTVSHPNLGDVLKGGMTTLGRMMQFALSEAYPDIAEMLEAGWHRDLDHAEGASDVR